MEKKAMGNFGEKLAVALIEKKKLPIIATNYQHKKNKGEVDIITKDGNFLVCVEVKLRGENHLVHPSQSITRGKQKKLIEVMNLFLEENPTYEDLEIRFDVIYIIKENNKYKNEWIEDAFSPIG